MKYMHIESIDLITQTCSFIIIMCGHSALYGSNYVLQLADLEQ